MDVKLRNLGKKTLIIVLSVMMVLTGMVFTTSRVSAMEAAGNCGAEGTYGDNVTYEFDSATGILTISGTGEMQSYSNNSPFYNAGSIKEVVIKEGVTSIGAMAFQNCSMLTKITLPNSVTTIGNQAFTSCSNLVSCPIPNGVATIGKNAFSDCSKLENITIPNSVTTIEDSAFYKCSGLKSIVIPSTITNMGQSVFSNCSGLTSATIADGVKTIANGEFYHCDNLTSITMPNSIESIENIAFSYCVSLTSMVIPEGVKTIGDVAFSNCKNLTSVTVPDSVTSIGRGVFGGVNANFQLHGYKGSTTETYAKTNTITFVELKEITDAMIVDIPAQTWTGSAIEPTVVVKDGETPLKLGDDYTVSYSNNDVAGEGIVTITGKGDYEYATATKTFEIKPPVYVFTDGTNQSFTVGKATDLTFTADGPLELLDKVYVNGTELDKANYTTVSGSTIVTLKKDYLNTLTAGTYELKLTYTNGSEVKTTFTVAKADAAGGTTSPTTGDASNMGLWITLLVLAAGTGAVAYRRKTDR